MVRIRFAAASAIITITAIAPASGYTDRGKLFTLEFPAGWTTPKTDATGNVQSDAPTGSDKVYCRANSNPMPSLKDVTQQELNATYKAPLDQATWASVLGVEAVKMKLVKGDARVVDGHVVQFATITFDADVLGMAATGRFASHIMVGRMVNAACFAGTKAYEGVSTTFEKVVASLKPI